LWLQRDSFPLKPGLVRTENGHGARIEAGREDISAFGGWRNYLEKT
jgi:hypothetical protein